MKTANLPSLRVDPRLRQAAEDVLREGESLSSFVEESVRAHVERRQSQRDFIERGLASRDKAAAAGSYIDAADVVAGLEERLAARRQGGKPR